MAKSIKRVSLIVYVVIFCARLGLGQADDASYDGVDADEIPGILSMLASTAQINYELIATWEGRIFQQTTSTTRGELAAELLGKYTEAEPNDSLNEIQRMYTRTIDFKIDVANDRFFSFSPASEPYAYVDTQNDISYLGNWGPEDMTFIATSEYQTKIAPLRKTADGVVLSKLAGKQRAGTIHMTDPRKVFYVGNKTLWRSLRDVSQSLHWTAAEGPDVVVRGKSAGNQVVYRIELCEPNRTQPFVALDLSSDVAFNRTYIKNWYDDGSLMSETTTQFASVQGIFVPKKWKVTQYFPDGGLLRQENCTIEYQQINATIDESVFSVRTHLHDGDRLRDKVAGKQFMCQDGELVEVSGSASEE